MSKIVLAPTEPQLLCTEYGVTWNELWHSPKATLGPLFELLVSEQRIFTASH
eukprot:SAG11_NODE_68_length_18649_cov_29.058005_9_plen_52_part_00